jgi:predicted amidohydrolase
MMKESSQQERIRAALIQPEIREEPDSKRLATMASLLDSARGADLVVLPELWRVGYFDFARYAAKAEPLGGETSSFLQERARTLRAFVLGGTIVEESDGKLYNTAILVDPQGERVVSYRKKHLLDYRSQERTLLCPGDVLEVVSTKVGILGLAICYDLRFPELFRTLAERGAEVVVVPAAWPASRQEAWDALSRARAVENQGYLLACNGTGKGLLGRSRVVDPWGVVVASLGERPGILEAELDLGALRLFRREFPAWRER